MFEKFDTIGSWWLPENPEKTLHGTLSYGPDSGAVLTLMGSFETEGKATKYHEYDIINGDAGGGITLFRCSTIEFPMIIWNESTVSTKCYASYVFKGHIFKKTSDIKFRYARINFSHLESWISYPMITSTFKKGIFDLTTSKFQPIIAKIDDNLQISLNLFTLPSSELKKDGMEIRIKERAYVDFETRTDIDFETCLEISSIFQQFLTVAVNRPVWMQEFTIEISDDGESDKPVSIFFKAPQILSEKNKYVHPSEMAFSLKNISDRYESVLKNWFEKRQFLGQIFNLYFALQYSEKMYIEHRFLNLVSYLESYHRRQFDGQYLSPENYTDFKRLLIESIPIIADNNFGEFKTKFIRSLEYGNEFSLRTRLKIIYDDSRSIISKYIPNRGQFIDKVVDTRNFRTHFDKTLEKSAISSVNDYYEYNLKLKMLVEICIFKELGFGLDEIDTFFSRNREYQHLIHPTAGEATLETARL